LPLFKIIPDDLVVAVCLATPALSEQRLGTLMGYGAGHASANGPIASLR
jgi:hypothetical protein